MVHCVSLISNCMMNNSKAKLRYKNIGKYMSFIYKHVEDYQSGKLTENEAVQLYIMENIVFIPVANRGTESLTDDDFIVHDYDLNHDYDWIHFNNISQFCLNLDYKSGSYEEQLQKLHVSLYCQSGLYDVLKNEDKHVLFKLASGKTRDDFNACDVDLFCQTYEKTYVDKINHLLDLIDSKFDLSQPELKEYHFCKNNNLQVPYEYIDKLYGINNLVFILGNHCVPNIPIEYMDKLKDRVLKLSGKLMDKNFDLCASNIVQNDNLLTHVVNYNVDTLELLENKKIDQTLLERLEVHTICVGDGYDWVYDELVQENLKSLLDLLDSDYMGESPTIKFLENHNMNIDFENLEFLTCDFCDRLVYLIASNPGAKLYNLDLSDDYGEEIFEKLFKSGETRFINRIDIKSMKHKEDLDWYLKNGTISKETYEILNMETQTTKKPKMRLI